MTVLRSRSFRSLLLALLLAFGSPGFSAETIDWTDLVPHLDQSLNPYNGMPRDASWAILRLNHIRNLKAAGKGDEKIDKIEQGYLAKLDERGYDLDEVMAQKAEFDRLEEANKTRLVDDIAGKQVRIAGYLLPTEFSGSKVVEFLLVPTEGACIHTPPPPVNQLVHVRWEQGFENRGLYDPVWVSGRISTGIVSEEVTYRDGSTSVEAGYSLIATSVVDYKN